MSENNRDWELDFEEFDWSVTDAGNSDDASLDKFFSTFDDVHASENLRASTLEAVFSEGDSQNSEHTVGSTGLADGKWGRTRRGNRHLAARPHRMRRVLAAVCVALVIAGAATWFVPLTSIAVEQDDLSVVFGVNVYGMTVSTTTQGDLSEQAVAQAGVTNKTYEDAISRVLDAYGKLTPNGVSSAASVSVHAPMGFGGDAIRRGAEHVAGEHAPSTSGGMENQGSATQGAESEPPQGQTQTPMQGQVTQQSQPTEGLPSSNEQLLNTQAPASDDGAPALPPSGQGEEPNGEGAMHGQADMVEWQDIPQQDLSLQGAPPGADMGSAGAAGAFDR